MTSVDVQEEINLLLIYLFDSFKQMFVCSFLDQFLGWVTPPWWEGEKHYEIVDFYFFSDKYLLVGFWISL